MIIKLFNPFLRYFRKGKTWLKSKLTAIKGQSIIKKKKAYFSKGDWVEMKDGTCGRVSGVFRSDKTNEITVCIIICNRFSSLRDHNFFTMVPAEDKGKKFNPVIRKIQNG